MKRIFCLCLFLIVSWVPLPQSFATDRCDQWVARVVSVKGVMEVQPVNMKSWQAANLDQTLCVGDSVRVAKRSRAMMQLQNGILVSLDQETKILFSKVDAEKVDTSWLMLWEGAVHVISRVAHHFKVKTEYMTTAIEGTEFVVRAEQKKSTVSVFDGRVRSFNDFGSVTIASGEAAIAEAGQAPRRQLLVKPRDAVQWALYYPPLIDFRQSAYRTGKAKQLIQKTLDHYQDNELTSAFASMETVPANLRDAQYFNLRAGLLLSVGRVDEARADIDAVQKLDPDNGIAVSLLSIIAVVQNEKEEALSLAQKAVELEPQSPVPQVALSYAYQAAFDIEMALEAVKKAADLFPNDALTWARVAELQLSLGYLNRALDAVNKAVALDPDLERTQTVLGFAYLTQIKIKEAKTAFEKAIEFDPSAPLPRLGLGLAKIRKGALNEGTQEIEIAASLDPNNALVRSYLGKAYFEQKRGGVASIEFDIAKELDPNDPTPWFYDAILNQTTNRPVEALHNVQKSIELNDNRAVYRGQLDMDGDQAVRGSSLARVYDDLGFDQLALVEASKSLSADPTNHSAHRFLSDTYTQLPRHEIARVSELLQAQLLQPINVNPVQPRLAVSDLNVMNGTGPAEAAFNEFTPLFERDQIRLTASGLVGNNDTLADEAVLSGILGRFSYSLGQFHSETDGFRNNNDLKNDLYDVFAQVAVSPSLNIQAEYRHRNTEQMDLNLDFDPDVREFPQNRLEIEQDTTRIGTHSAPSPHSDLIFSFINSNRVEKQGVPSSRVQTEDRGYQIEGQYLFRSNWFNMTTGIGNYKIDVTRLGKTLSDFTRKGDNAYVYANIAFPKNLSWTIGLSYDSFEERSLGLDELNPKVGLQWELNDNLRLRLAMFQTVKRALIADQTLEPTQVAGFNQFFDDLNGAETERYGIGLDARLTDSLYGGLEVSRRDIKSPSHFLMLDGTLTVRFEDRQEDLYRAYLYWKPHSNWVVTADYSLDRFRKKGGINTNRPNQVKTTSLPMALRYFSPLGFFAELGATFVDQEVDRHPKSKLKAGSENFIIVDASLGYRLPNRRGIISLEVGNLLNEAFLFQDDNFRTSEIRSPRFIPDRTILGQVTLNF